MRRPMKLLLLSCCAPCSCAVIEKLARDKVDFAVYFDDPNIMPAAEYEKRRDEQKRLCDGFGVPFIEGVYDPESWLAAVKGLENEPERGKRCSACFLFRLRRAARYASENGFDAFSSVLGVSRHKDMNQVNACAKQASEETGVPYDFTNWRKGGLEPRRAALIREKALYNQTYCGCPFSAKK